MARTFTEEVGTGSSQVYDIHWESTLGYLDVSHVYVYYGDDFQVDNIPFTWINELQIECVATGDFTIRRVVPRDTPINDYEDGAILNGDTLDESFAQGLMIQEEITDGYTSSSGLVIVPNGLDLRGNTISNLGYPVNLTDAASVQSSQDQDDLVKVYADNKIVEELEKYSLANSVDYGTVTGPVDDTLDYGGI